MLNYIYLRVLILGNVYDFYFLKLKRTLNFFKGEVNKLCQFLRLII